MRGLASAHGWLLRALRLVVAGESDPLPVFPGTDGGYPAFIIEEFSDEPWASLTFAGTRHRLGARLDGPAAAVDAAYQRVCSLVAEPDIAIPGYFLAEIEVTPGARVVQDDGRASVEFTVEALTIED